MFSINFYRVQSVSRVFGHHIFARSNKLIIPSSSLYSRNYSNNVITKRKGITRKKRNKLQNNNKRKICNSNVRINKIKKDYKYNKFMDFIVFFTIICYISTFVMLCLLMDQYFNTVNDMYGPGPYH